jgi:hypothetical protein
VKTDYQAAGRHAREKYKKLKNKFYAKCAAQTIFQFYGIDWKDWHGT